MKSKKLQPGKFWNNRIIENIYVRSLGLLGVKPGFILLQKRKLLHNFYVEMSVCSSECVFSYHGDDCTQQLEFNSWPDPSTMRPYDTYIVNNGDSLVKIYIQLYAALSSAYELMNPTLNPSVDTALFYESGWGAFG